MKNLFKILLVGLLVAVGSATAADTFKVDASHSDIGFTVKHMVISKVRGAFHDYTVEMQLDPKRLESSSVKAVIQAASIDTDNEKRDEHLRGEDFFEVAKFPTLVFESKRIEKRETGWVAIGDFTLHGVTKTIELPFTMSGPITDPWGNVRAGFEATITIDRRDYGLRWSNALETGGLVVDNLVEIQLALEMVKQ